MSEFKENAKVLIDGVQYVPDDLSDVAKNQIANIQFSDKQILQLQNELAISNTARVGYVNALKAELAQVEEVDA